MDLRARLQLEGGRARPTGLKDGIAERAAFGTRAEPFRGRRALSQGGSRGFPAFPRMKSLEGKAV